MRAEGSPPPPQAVPEWQGWSEWVMVVGVRSCRRRG